MRIGQFSDSFLPVLDGVGRVVYSYAKTLGDLGHDVTVFVPMDDMGDLSACPFRVAAYTTLKMPGKLPYRVGVPRLDPRFERRLRAAELDIVHAHDPFMMGYAALRAARRRGLPAVATFHSKYYDDFQKVLKLEAFAKIGVKQVVEFYEQFDEVWAVSAASGETLKSYGYTGEVVVMPNGTELRPLDGAVLPQVRERFSIRDDRPVLLYVGQLNWKKNILKILKAAKLLMDAGCSFQLLLAGQGPDRDDIEKTVRALGLGERMAFTGHLGTRELDGLYSLSSLLVFPSLYDNAPMVVREAAAMGTPAVLVEGSSSAEGLEDGVNAFLCEDAEASLASAIRSGLSDRELLGRVGERARGTIPVPWTALMGRVVERYEALVEWKKGQLIQGEA